MGATYAVVAHLGMMPVVVEEDAMSKSGAKVEAFVCCVVAAALQYCMEKTSFLRVFLYFFTLFFVFF